MVVSKQGQGCERQGVLGLSACVSGETPEMCFPICLADCGFGLTSAHVAFVTRCECLSVSGVREGSFITY